MTAARNLAPWETETHEERARRVCREADRLQLLWELRRLALAPTETQYTPVERPSRMPPANNQESP